MGKLDIQGVKTDNFNTELIDNEGRPCLKLVGELDTPNPWEFLEPFLDELHNQICLAQITEIDLNIIELSFINSSSIKTLLNWLLKIKKLDAAARYKVYLIYDKEKQWQSTSFKALSIFVSECFFIEY